MSYIKTEEEIKQITEGGIILGRILEDLSKMVVPGISASKIDQAAEKMIKEAGGIPAFKGYKTDPSDPPFPSTICACINDEVVHGIPTKEKILKEGDMFSIDIGMKWPSDSSGQTGYYTDTALTTAVGNITEEARQLLKVTKEALDAGIEAVNIGGSIADIGRAVENSVGRSGTYGIVRDLVGHGVGHAVHEDPRVPNYYDEDLEQWKIEPGVVIAIEPMITLGGYKVLLSEDGWTITTADGSLAAHFEHTIVVTDTGPLVATRRPSE